ncbi:cupredoxin domain-containing protein [Parapusillimonas sp. JC17]|uniref:cupredoxin domain-containing protein n=1 Tax=Parapusillimonas sp. JC17 TaxID=3445768 RepID=UPI003F9ECE24
METLSKLVLAAVLTMLPLELLAIGDKEVKAVRQSGTERTNSHIHGRAIGRPGDSSKVDKAVAMTVNDATHFEPSRIKVKAGDTVLFKVKNTGDFSHEMVLGTIGDLRAHAVLMQKEPAMEHVQSNVVTLNPGQTSTITWKFMRSGKVDFACLVSWHLKFGTLGEIIVE